MHPNTNSSLAVMWKKNTSEFPDFTPSNILTKISLHFCDTYCFIPCKFSKSNTSQCMIISHKFSSNSLLLPNIFCDFSNNYSRFLKIGCNFSNDLLFINRLKTMREIHKWPLWRCPCLMLWQLGSPICDWILFTHAFHVWSTAWQPRYFNLLLLSHFLSLLILECILNTIQKTHVHLYLLFFHMNSLWNHHLHHVINHSLGNSIKQQAPLKLLH